MPIPAAKRTKRTHPTTPEARALDDALSAGGYGIARRIADALGITDGNLTHWRHGTRTMPAKYAVAVADWLPSVTPDDISSDYRKVLKMAGERDLPSAGNKMIQSDDPDYPLDALVVAVMSLYSVMVLHRPVEAADVAAHLRRMIPPARREHPLFVELFGILDRGAA